MSKHLAPLGPLVLLATTVLAAAAPDSILAAPLTHESPEVKRCVDAAIRFLEQKDTWDERMGGQALIGLALIKHGAKPNHPKVASAISTIQQRVATNDLKSSSSQEIIYSAGLATIFLCELDPEKYQNEIQNIVGYLRSVQKPHGGWGYLEKETGDTSMTQYGALAMWEAAHAGIDVPLETVERAMLWLLKTQDPSGAFGYQGVVSPTFDPVPQDQYKTIGLTSAAMASTYVLADILGLYDKRDSSKPALPKALIPVEDPATGGKRTRTNIEPRVLRELQVKGTRWMAANLQLNTNRYRHYFLYALERYSSMREMAEGSLGDFPTWYDPAARMLIETQAPDGSWKLPGETTGVVPDTAFGTLFLMRSMKKSIERVKLRQFGAGMLVGGRGLPGTTADTQVRSGQVVTVPQLSQVDELLGKLEETVTEEDLAKIEGLAASATGDGELIISKHAARLRQLAGSESPEARLAAVTALGQTNDLANAPTLIYVLGDDDPAIVAAADAGLRRISRRFEGEGMPDDPTETQRRAAIEKWQAWYRDIRPDARFDEPAESP